MARTAGSNAEDTRRNLREAALRLFSNSGYAAVSMRMIAKEVDLQAGALYHHFPTKQALLVDLMESHMHALLLAWEKESKNFTDPVSALEGFIRFHIRFHFDKQDEVFISYMELRNLEEDGLAQMQKLRRYYEGFLRKIISIGKDSGDFTVQDVPVSAMAIISMLTGVNAWFKNNGRLTASQVEEIYVAMALNALSAGDKRNSGGLSQRLESNANASREPVLQS
ncbi:MAG: TetR/AcrR family transcriptional regulator [Salaquimonas sp.]